MIDALILVDIQNDFLPGGALAVPDGDAVIEIANRLIPEFDVVVATQDWHPADHGSFASQYGLSVGDRVELNGLNQILWPDHCVQGSSGAEFSAELNLPDDSHVIQKGTDRNVDSYSGFFDNGHRNATGMDTLLKELSIARLFVMGLATDYCVKFTVLDALQLGYETVLIEDGCRGVDLTEGDVAAAILEMKSGDATVVSAENIANVKKNE